MFIRKLFVALLPLTLFFSLHAEEYDFEIIRTVLFPIRYAILSAEVESTIKEHKFREGESFDKGEVLIELDDFVMLQQKIRAESALKEAESGEAFAERNLSRMLNLDKAGVTAGYEAVDKARMEVEVAKSKIVHQKSNFEMAEHNIKNCKILAPFSGRVVRRLFQEHEYIRAGQQVIQIIDDTQLLAVMHMPSIVRNKTRIGDEITVKIDETETVHTGSIYEISGEVDSGSRTFEIKVLLDNKDKTLVSGMSGVYVVSNGKEQSQ